MAYCVSRSRGDEASRVMRTGQLRRHNDTKSPECIAVAYRLRRIDERMPRKGDDEGNEVDVK